MSVPCAAPGGIQHVLGVRLSWPGPGAAPAENMAHRPGGRSVLTRDRLASGRNCPNSESRSSWPRKRLATSVNTSSSDMPRKGRPFVLSCSFCQLLGKGKQVVSQGTRHPGCDIQAFYCGGEEGSSPTALLTSRGALQQTLLSREQYSVLTSQQCSATRSEPWPRTRPELGVWKGHGQGHSHEGPGPSTPMDKGACSARQRGTELALGLEEEWVKRKGSDFPHQGTCLSCPQDLRAEGRQPDPELKATR